MDKDYSITGTYELEIKKNEVTMYWSVPAFDKTIRLVNPTAKQLCDIIRYFRLKPVTPKDGIVMHRYFYRQMVLRR